jgi:hypothetical protein
MIIEIKARNKQGAGYNCFYYEVGDVFGCPVAAA